jgi:hypothetical protein
MPFAFPYFAFALPFASLFAFAFCLLPSAAAGCWLQAGLYITLPSCLAACCLQ